MAGEMPTAPTAAKLKIKKKNGPGLIEQVKNIFAPVTTYFISYMESSKIDIDLLYMITYMDSISTADINRDEIFRLVSEREQFVCSKYMKQVYMLAKNWNYEYSVACMIVSRRVANKRLKELLARLANAMSSGEPEKKFLDSEWSTMIVIYKNEYERSLESLKKWTDAYTALLVSMAFVAVTVLISVILYNIGDPQTTIISTLLIIGMVAFVGVFILRSEAPKETKAHNLNYASVERTKARAMAKVFLPVAVIVSSLLFMFNAGIGFVFVAFGLLIAPIGWVAAQDDKNIDNRDRDFSQFTKMLGSVVGGMGVTIKEGINKIDMKSIGSLQPLVKKLHVQLIMGMEPRLCWLKFVGATGSDLINKFTYIFLDAIDLGGDATKVGKLVNTTNLEVVLLRMKRKMVSSSFTTLAIPMHAAMTGLIIFIVEILVIFSTMLTQLYSTLDFNSYGDISGGAGVSAASMGFTLFQNVDTGLLIQFSYWMALILTVANTFASNYVDGGQTFKLCYYGSIMCIITGVCLLLVPPVVQAIFSFPLFTSSATQAIFSMPFITSGGI
jgi:archaeal flagellar protein FlaJ